MRSPPIPRGAPADPRLVARLVIDSIEGLTHRFLLRPPQGVGPADVDREITELVRAYVRSRSTQRTAPAENSAAGF
jgi:hypothetical protein